MVNSKLRELIKRIKGKYPNLNLEYEYITEDEVYRIYFDKEEFSYNIEFDSYVGELMFIKRTEKLFSNSKEKIVPI